MIEKVFTAKRFPTTKSKPKPTKTKNKKKYCSSGVKQKKPPSTRVTKIQKRMSSKKKNAKKPEPTPAIVYTPPPPPKSNKAKAKAHTIHTTVLNSKLIKVEPKQTATVTITTTKAATTTTQAAEPQPELSFEDRVRLNAAVTLQSHWRRHLAVALRKKAKAAREALDEKMKKMEEEAFVQMVKMEREREDWKRQKELKEKQLRQKREARRKRFMEAAYDGNLTEMHYLLSDLEMELEGLEIEVNPDVHIPLDEGKRQVAIMSLIDCKDKNDNTALSEAASGGSAEVVRYLLERNASPNSKGLFGRTPLWRAAFAGHLNCVQILLENGADPRIYSQDGQRVVDATTNSSIVELLKNWNIQLTERMLQQIEKHRLEVKKEQLAGLDARRKAAHDEYTRIQKQYETCKNELLKCNLELQRLHDEWALNERMYGDLIEKKESERIELNSKCGNLRDQSTKARIAYKDLLKEVNEEKRMIKKSKGIVPGSAEEADEVSKNKLSGESYLDEEEMSLDDANSIKININEIDDMIIRDMSDAIKKSEDKWPLIVDSNDLAVTFLRYRDTNYLNCLDMQAMQPDKVRTSLIGAIRYGKPLVVDLMQYDQELLESLKTVCGQISLYPGLFEHMFNKQLMRDDNFLKLVNLAKDGKDYEAQYFNAVRLKNFKVLFITSNPYPCEKLQKITLPFKVISTGKSSDDLFDF